MDRMLVYGVKAAKGCAICGSQSGLLQCGSCKAVSYCGTEHQKEHRSSHKLACIKIKKTRESLEHEEAALRAHPVDIFNPADVFNTHVGSFWGILGTRDYMRARFAAANALLQINTPRAVELALEHFKDMLRLCRSDNLGVRDIIPHLLLRLDREQECYDFIKWWATIDDKDHCNGRYNWGDVTLPYLDISGANVFEPLKMVYSPNMNRTPCLSHLVALTLLKLRLYLDINAYVFYEEEDEDLALFEDGRCCDLSDYDSDELNKPIGSLARAKLSRISIFNASRLAKKMESQYQELCKVVYHTNPHFWDSLVAEEDPELPSYYSPGSEEEASLVVHQCLRAWQESEDALVMVNADTSEFAPRYEGAAAGADGADGADGVADVRSAQSGDLLRQGREEQEKRRGTGKVFPSKFESTSSPAALFPPTPTGRSQIVRFVCCNDPKKALVYVDGACANNGQVDAHAGWAVVCGPPLEGSGKNNCSIVSGALEINGPFGDKSLAATSNRAELRAVIAALRACDWSHEGFESIVIATDSSYVVNGATGWVKSWVRNGWKTRVGEDVKNKDLWDLLLGEVETWKQKGFQVEVWKIPRALNGDADAAAKQAAKQAAENGRVKTDFTDILLYLPQPGTTQVGSRRILTLCLENEALFDACFENLISGINSGGARMERVTTPEAALAKLTAQHSLPSVILVADDGLARQRKVCDKVIDRLRAGATVVLAGCFSSSINGGDFTRFFSRIGLPWQRGSYHRATVTLRRSNVSNDLASRLLGSYNQKATFVRNIDRSTAWYTEGQGFEEAAVVFAPVGSGRLGYIGDVNGEEGSDKAVLAMCGLLN